MKKLIFVLILVFTFASSFANNESMTNDFLNGDVSCTQTTTTTTTISSDGASVTITTSKVTCDTLLELLDYIIASEQ